MSNRKIPPTENFQPTKLTTQKTADTKRLSPRRKVLLVKKCTTTATPATDETRPTRGRDTTALLIGVGRPMEGALYALTSKQRRHVLRPHRRAILKGMRRLLAAAFSTPKTRMSALMMCYVRVQFAAFY